MKRKLILISTILLLCSLFFFGCNKEYVNTISGKSITNNITPINEYTDDFVVISDDRKVIYTVEAIMYGNELNSVSKSIKESMSDDEWLESETINNYRIYTVIKIKTENLNDFLNNLKQCGTVKNITRKADDVTIEYQDNQAKYDALLEKKDRFNQIMTSYSYQENIEISSNIDDIDVQIQNISKKQLLLEQSIEYSTVSIIIYDN